MKRSPWEVALRTYTMYFNHRVAATLCGLHSELGLLLV